MRNSTVRAHPGIVRVKNDISIRRGIRLGCGLQNTADLEAETEGKKTDWEE